MNDNELIYNANYKFLSSSWMLDWLAQWNMLHVIWWDLKSFGYFNGIYHEISVINFVFQCRLAMKNQMWDVRNVHQVFLVLKKILQVVRHAHISSIKIRKVGLFDCMHLSLKKIFFFFIIGTLPHHTVFYENYALSKTKFFNLVCSALFCFSAASVVCFHILNRSNINIILI